MGTPTKRMSIAGCPKTPDDELSKLERKERRRTHFDASTSRKSTINLVNKNLKNISAINENDETIQFDENTPIEEHNITKMSENFDEIVSVLAFFGSTFFLG